MSIENLIANYGLTPVAVGVALLVIVLGIVYIQQSGNAPTPADNAPKVLLHPEHVKYMNEKEETYTSKHVAGKGMRCIIDYLREEKDETVNTIFAEKPKFDEGFESYDLFIHPPQLEWLESKGIKIGTEKGEEYKELSRVMRASFDWAMRMEAEGNSQDATVFEEERCLNCGY